MTHAVSDYTDVTLSSDPNRAMQEMMVTIDALRQVMIKETSALNDADAAGFLSLQDDKLDAARAYQSGMAQMLSRKEELRGADATLRGRLEEMQKGFHEITLANRDGLERMKNGTNRLRDKIMMAARETALSESRFAYGSSGKMQGDGRASIGVSESA